MKDLYIYKTIKDYYLLKSENIPQNTLFLLKNIESYLKDISDFLGALHLQCEGVFPDGRSRQFEFGRTEIKYKIRLALDCKDSTFFFAIKINNSDWSAYRSVYRTDYWVDLSNIKQEIENFKKWVEN